MAQPELPTALAPRRRRWPFVLLGVVLALFVVLALAPGFASGPLASMIATGFNETRQGRLEIRSLDLGWTGRQSVSDARLLDAQGVEIARVSVDLPPLLDLARSGGAKLGRVVVRASADLVADDAGVTNLDRALAERPEAKKPESSSEESGASSTDLGDLLRRLQLELDVQVERLSWSDATTRAAGQPFALNNLKLLVMAEPGQPLRADASGVLSGLSSGVVQLKASVAELFRGSELNPDARFELDARLDALPSALVDTLARQDGLVALALGPNFTVSAKGQGTLRDGALELAIVGADGRVDVRGALAQGVLTGSGAHALEVRLAPQPASLERVLRTKLPEGVTLAANGAPSVQVRVSDLRVELQRILEALNAQGDVVAVAIGAARANLTLETNAWRVVGPFAQGAGLDVGALKLETRLAPEESRTPLSLTARTALSAAGSPAEAAKVTFTLTCPDLAQAAALTRSGELAPTVLALELDRLPASLFEALSPGAGAQLAKLPAGPLKLASTLEFSRAAPGKLDTRVTLGSGAQQLEVALDAQVEDAFGLAKPRAEGALPPAKLRLALNGVRQLRALLPEAHADTVLEMLGEKLTADVDFAPAADAKGIDNVALQAQVRAERIELASSMKLEGSALSGGSAAPLALDLRLTQALVERYVGANLPAGATLVFADASPAIAVRLDRLALPLDAWMGDAAAAPVPLGATLRRTDALLRVELPALTFTQPAVGGGAAVPIALQSLKLDATLAASKPAQLEFSGALGGANPSVLSLRATSADLGAFVDGFSTPGGVPAAAALVLSGDVSKLPTALVDALAGQNGLLVDVLGPEMNFKLAGSWPSAAGDPLRAEMTSQTASLKLEAGLDGLVLKAPEKGGIEAQLPLSPLFSERIVGKLVPLCLNATKPQGASPVALNVRKFELPLDGDLSKLNALVELELGDIAYDLLPGLSNTLAPLGLQGAGKRTAKLGKLSLPIVNGVVGYDSLPLSIGGQDLVFKGAFNLATQEFDLGTNLPLDALATKFNTELDAVRKYLDPKMLVPLQLKGTWKSPKLRLSDDFTKKVLKDAAEKAAGDALQGGLQDLLGGKKKKKD